MLEFYIMPRPLKTESCHYGSFSVTGGKGGGRCYNLRCHQLRQSWHYDNFWLSMKLKRYMFHSLGREEHPHLPCSGADNCKNRSNYDTSNRFGTDYLWGSLFKKKTWATQNFNMAAIFQDGRHGES